MSQPLTYLTKPKVAERYGKTIRTIDNWMRDDRLNFPVPIVIRGREHFPINGTGGLDEWDAAQVRPNGRKRLGHPVDAEKEAA